MPKPKFTTTITNDETAAAERAGLSQARLAAAPIAYAVALQETEDAADHLAAVEASFRHGTEAHDFTEHAVAVSAVRCTELRVVGAEREVQEAQRSTNYIDTDVAHAVSEAVASAVPGSLIVTHVTPSGQPANDERPLAVLTQDGPTLHTDSGMVSANLTLRAHLTDYHSRLSEAKIQAALDRAGVYAQVGSVREQGGGLYVVTIKVSGAVSGDPVIPVVESMFLRGVASQLARAAITASSYSDESPRFDPYTNLLEGKQLAAVTFGTPTSEETIEDGRRSLVVTSSLSVRHKGVLPNGAAVFDLLTTAAEGLHGRLISHLGVVESISVTGADADDSKAARAMIDAGVAPGSSGSAARAFVVTATLTSLVAPPTEVRAEGADAA